MADGGGETSNPTRPPALDVVEVGLACCALEAAASACMPCGAAPTTGLAEPGYAAAAAGATATGRTVLVVAGTVTNAMAATIKARYDATPGPVAVVAFGACATTGGPYWDSYAVTPGIGRVLPVDIAVPGCPPRPEELAAALADLHPTKDAP